MPNTLLRAAPSTTTPAYPIEYRQLSLANGLRIVCAHRPWSRTFAAILMVRAGARDEPEGQAGIGHLLEHLLFRGSNEAVVRRLCESGVYLNAESGWDHTLYVGTGHTSQLAETLGFFRNVLTPVRPPAEEMHQEIQILEHELAVTGESPGDWALRKFTARIIGDHDLARPIPKNFRNLKRLGGDEVAAFHATWYAPANVTLTIVSPATPDEVSALVDASLGSLGRRPGPAARRPFTQNPPAPLTVARFGGSHAFVMVCHAFEPSPRCSLPAVSILNDHLGGGPSSTLFRSIRQEQRMAYQVGSALASYGPRAVLNVSAVVPRRRVRDVLGQILGQVGALGGNGLPEPSFEAARARVVRSFDLLEDSPQSLCDFLARTDSMQNGALETPESYRAELEAFTAEHIDGVARHVFTPAQRAVIVLGPVGAITRWSVERLLRQAAS